MEAKRVFLPLRGVRQLANGSCEAIDSNPQFVCHVSPLPRAGWHILCVRVGKSRGPIVPQVFVDTGMGFNQAESFHLPELHQGTTMFLLGLPAGARHVRLDPSNTSGPLSLTSATLLQMPRTFLGVALLLNRISQPRYLKALAFRIASEALTFTGRFAPELMREFSEQEQRVGRRRALSPQFRLDPSPMQPPSAPVDVVIPCYRGLAETRRCLASVLASRGGSACNVVVIDDASPEPALSEYLGELAKAGEVVLLKNHSNRGFVACANRGMSLHNNTDVVLLNSDTEVASDWLARLRRTAYAHPRIGTVTPFSNNADFCSFPSFCEPNPLPADTTVAEMDRAFAIANGKTLSTLPTGCGFCMYIRRDCLSQVGLFDENAFGRGYGEENDFCLKASKLRWHHILATDVFVYHKGEVSFRTRTSHAKTRALGIIRDRYPYYDRLIQNYVAADPAWQYRMAAEFARADRRGTPVILLVCHAHGGGTLKHVNELADAIDGRARVLIIAPDGPSRVMLSTRGVAPPASMFFELPSDYPGLIELLDSCQVSRVHVHHVRGFPRNFLRRLVYDLSVPMDFTIHDYQTLCPWLKLSDESEHYCKEACTSSGTCVRKQSVPFDGVDSWRAHHEWLLRDADRVIAPSNDVCARMRRHGITREIVVTPHLFRLPGSPPQVCKPVRDAPLRVLVLGAFARSKGAAECVELAEYAVAKRLPLEFHVLGRVEDARPKRSCGTFIYHGPYRDEDLVEKVAQISPNIAWFPAQWPETFSYTLSEALSLGLPIVASGIGAFPERLAGRPETWITPSDISTVDMARIFLAARETLMADGAKDRPEVPPATPPAFYEREYLTRSWTLADSGLRDIRVPGKVTVAAVVSASVDGIPDACAHIRVLLPLRHPAMSGTVRLWTLAPHQATHYRPDILLVQRASIGDMGAAKATVAHCRAKDIRLVYEIDDDLLNMPASHPERRHYSALAPVMKYLASAADVVLVSTEDLAGVLGRINKNTIVIENGLDDELWFGKLDGTDAASSMAYVNRILYAGTPTHVPDLLEVLPALGSAIGRCGGGSVLEVVGFAPPKLPIWCRRYPVPREVAGNYPAFVRWLRRQKRWAMGIAPLRDVEFNHRKSAIKYYDYAGLGLATVAPANSPFDKAITDGENGRLVQSLQQGWEDAIAELLNSKASRARLAASAVRDVRANHVLSRTVPTLRAALTAIAESRGGRGEADVAAPGRDTQLRLLPGPCAGWRPWTSAFGTLAPTPLCHAVLMRMERLSRSGLGGFAVGLVPRRLREIVGRLLGAEW